MTRSLAAIVLAAFAAALFPGCAGAPPKKDYTAFRSAELRSVLILPVVNRSVDVHAPDYFLSTLAIPVAERGYYVFPVDMVKHLLEDDGLADPDLVHGADPAKLCSLFGSDSVLYVSIERWDARYLVLTTQVTVDFDYKLKDCRTGDVLWAERKAMVYSPQQNQSGGSPVAALVSMAVSAAITKAAPNYMPMAHQVNAGVFAYPNGPGLPAGPYLPQHGKDYPE